MVRAALDLHRLNENDRIRVIGESVMNAPASRLFLDIAGIGCACFYLGDIHGRRRMAREIFEAQRAAREQAEKDAWKGGGYDH